MKKLIGVVLLVILIAVVGGGFYLSSNGTKLIKTAVVTYGPDVTGTPIGLSNVALSPLTGKAGLSGLSIGTPAGYSAPYTFKVDDASIALKPMSLLDDVLVIEDITIASPSIIFEPKGKSSNIQALQDSVNSYLGPSDPNAKLPGPEKLIIKRFAITAPKVTVFAGDMLGEKSVTAPDIILTDMGVKEGGVPPGEIAQAAMASLQPQILAAIKSQAGQMLVDQALKEAAKKGLPVDDLKGMVKGENMEDNIKKGVGGLLKKLK
ncbi:MAG: hypothetical protein AAF607_00245 [Pseudomonadota bacterium]